MKRIVIATDGSAESTVAVAEGIELAQGIDAAVTFVSVRPAIPFLGSPYYEQKLRERLAEARAAVDEAMAVAAGSGVEADYEILEGDPAEEILRLAHSRDADLVVVGSRGLGAVGRALLGSVSSAVVHGADRPVLVTKARAAAASHA